VTHMHLRLGDDPLKSTNVASDAPVPLIPVLALNQRAGPPRATSAHDGPSPLQSHRTFYGQTAAKLLFRCSRARAGLGNIDV
jgi:hypothetical protein